MGLYPVAVSYNARQDNTVSTVNTIQYVTITHHTKQRTTLEATLNAQNLQPSMRKIGNSQYAKLATISAQNWQPSISKIGKPQCAKFLNTPKIAVTHTGPVSAFIFYCGI
jgi:hypothetical protein